MREGACSPLPIPTNPGEKAFRVGSSPPERKIKCEDRAEAGCTQRGEPYSFLGPTPQRFGAGCRPPPCLGPQPRVALANLIRRCSVTCNHLNNFIIIFFYPVWSQKKKMGKNWGQREAAVFQPSSESLSARRGCSPCERLSGRRFPLVGQDPCCGPP